MNRSYSETKSISVEELNRKTAIHEAGHVAAIYLGNKQKQLPPVFFQIVLNARHRNGNSSFSGVAKVEGGRLIHNLPSSIETAGHEFSDAQKQAYRQAIESDIINLLVGPLAEATYVAQRDGEPISPSIVNLNALHDYGGSSDLAIIDDYLHCFIADTAQHEQKIAELFLAAFDFVNHWPHWFAITALADYILMNDKQLIGYEEITTVLDAHFSFANQRLACRFAFNNYNLFT